MPKFSEGELAKVVGLIVDAHLNNEIVQIDKCIGESPYINKVTGDFDIGILYNVTFRDGYSGSLVEPNLEKLPDDGEPTWEDIEKEFGFNPTKELENV